MNIILTGFMGTGKTAVGKRLAKRLGWRFVDVDREIEAAAGMPVARIFSERGEAVFRRLERRHINRVIHGRDQVIATGGGAVVDPLNRGRLRASGVIVCLTAKAPVILARVGARLRTRPLLSGRAKPLTQVRALLERRAPAYAQADLTIDTSRLSVDEVVDRVWRALSPSICRSWRYFLAHVDELSHRFGGKYVVVADDRIIGSGQTQLEAYHSAPARLTEKPGAGIYYIPLREESLTVLHMPGSCAA